MARGSLRVLFLRVALAALAWIVLAITALVSGAFHSPPIFWLGFGMLAAPMLLLGAGYLLVAADGGGV